MRPLRLIVTFALIHALFAPSASAFYEWSGDGGSLELRGAVRAIGSAYRNPDEPALYPDETGYSAGGFLRLIALGDFSGVRFDFNAFNLTSYTSAQSPLLGQNVIDATERSPALLARYMDEEKTRGYIAVDRLSLAITFGRFDITVGRQPVNFATTFYFTPNDFFAPFAAQTFYRLYKPGVDAARIELRINPLSQLTFLGALGYEADPDSFNGFSNSVSGKRSSSIIRYTAVVFESEAGLIAGKLGEKNVIGVSFQTDLFKWLGIRAEGHMAYPEDETVDDYAELAVEFEHRFENSLYLRLAWFHHGQGLDDRKDYFAAISAGQDTGAYLGREYVALGASYEVSPLMGSEFVAIANLTDGSWLLSVNSVHSLSDEGEFSWGFSVPMGDKPELFNIKSEYGLFPVSVNAELRLHF